MSTTGVSPPRRAREEPAAAQQALRTWPLLVVLGGVVVGLAVALLGQATWRLGCLVVGGSLGLGAMLRLALPSRAAGLLQVRSKAFDTGLLIVLAAAVIVLALVVPNRR